MSFMFGIPAFTFFGEDSSKQVGDLIKSLNCKKAFCVYDKGVKAAGIVDNLIEIIKGAGVEVMEYDGVLPNPPDTIVEEAAQIARGANVDIVVAIGGGSSIDCAKAINILLSNPSPINQYDGPNKVQNPGKPLIAIPTTAGTSSEVTRVTVITDTKQIKKMVILGQNVGATYALIDPLLTLGLPPAITAATGMDALTHAIESYTSVTASVATEINSLKAIEIIVNNLPEAVKNGSNKEARSNMMLGCLLAGIAFCNADLGLVHAIAHPLSAHCGLAHGDANAAMLPYVVSYNAAVVPEKTKDIAEAMGIDVEGKSAAEAADMAFKAIKELSKEIGIRTLKDLGVPRTIFNTIAEDALKEGALMFNPRKPSKGEILALLEQAF
ncbi:MAG: iron-containing alcohol dehydrogenase [Peptococcaceae bacterium]|nr:iron-containing alcohol dehydrogenase [Peptococcaceae bacterium]MDH7524954.1 iron-containing alcohol dehydrogenase [Peptococcaceae bacterium]